MDGTTTIRNGNGNVTYSFDAEKSSPKANVPDQATDNIFVNSSGSPGPLIDITVLDALGYVVYILPVVTACLGVMLNVVVLQALRTIPDSALKANYLIQITLLTDMTHSVLLGAKIVPYIATAFGIKNSSFKSCFDSIAFDMRVIAVFAQSGAGIGLGIDRILALTRPFEYHLTRYSMKTKLTMIFIIFLFGALLGLPCIIVPPFVSQIHTFVDLCAFTKQGSWFWIDIVLPFTAMMCVILTFIIYCIVYAMALVHKSRRKNLTTNQTHQQQKHLSLALTFFLIHATYVFLYLPTPLLVIAHRGKYLNRNYVALVYDIYQLNTVVDPIIFISRIEVLKTKVFEKFKLGGR